MNTLLFSILIALIVVADLAWDLNTPGWVIASSVVAYTLLATAEFELDTKARGVLWSLQLRYRAWRARKQASDQSRV